MSIRAAVGAGSGPLVHAGSHGNLILCALGRLADSWLRIGADTRWSCYLRREAGATNVPAGRNGLARAGGDRRHLPHRDRPGRAGARLSKQQSRLS